MSQLSRKDWILLALLTLAWGINWPVMKLGVNAYPPLTFRTISMVIGLPVLWIAARQQGASLAIPPGRALDIARLALPNMMIWHVFMILSVTMLTSGRSAILGYTMPVWAVLSGLLFFRERLDGLAWLGVGCALGGAVLLLSSEFSAFSGSPLGTLTALIAAAGWGFGTVLLKRARIEMPTISLTFWMLAMTTVAMTVLAYVFEGARWQWPDAVTWGTILYNALIVFGFAHVVWFQLARTLPPVASSLSIMMIPVLGVFFGAWMLDENLHWQDYGAMVLILVAMSTVLLKPAVRAGT